VGCRYGETSCSLTGEKGTSSAYNARESIREVPQSVFSEADYPVASAAFVGASSISAVASASTSQKARQALYQQQQSRQKTRLTTRSASAAALPSTGAYNSQELHQVSLGQRLKVYFSILAV